MIRRRHPNITRNAPPVVRPVTCAAISAVLLPCASGRNRGGSRRRASWRASSRRYSVRARDRRHWLRVRRPAAARRRRGSRVRPTTSGCSLRPPGDLQRHEPRARGERWPRQRGCSISQSCRSVDSRPNPTACVEWRRYAHPRAVDITGLLPTGALPNWQKPTTNINHVLHHRSSRIEGARAMDVGGTGVVGVPKNGAGPMLDHAILDHLVGGPASCAPRAHGTPRMALWRWTGR
jgi:hypothetical protein